MTYNCHKDLKRRKMDINAVRHIKALTYLNAALFKRLETALLVMEKWDNMSDNKKDDIVSSLRFLVENNRAAFNEKPTLH